jgi:uncharacterized protein
VRVLKISLSFAAILYMALLVVFFVTQRSLLYYPNHAYTPLASARANKAFSEISVKTRDGVELKAWYAPSTTKAYTIVFFHGNADSLQTAAQIADPYIASGYGFLLAEYRGYSGLPGKPTEVGLYSDARAYVQDLLGRGIQSKNIILYGHSLGTGVAVQMATEFHVGGLMLLAPYLSIPKVAQKHFPFMPATLLALDRFDNEEKIRILHIPLFIANGSRDEVISPLDGETLFMLANEPKEFHSFPNLGHNDAFEEFAPSSLEWIQRVCH